MASDTIRSSPRFADTLCGRIYISAYTARLYLCPVSFSRKPDRIQAASGITTAHRTSYQAGRSFDVSQGGDGGIDPRLRTRQVVTGLLTVLRGMLEIEERRQNV